MIKAHASALLDGAPDAMIIADSRGTIIYANHHSATLFGYSSNELVGQHVEMLLPERFRKGHPALRAEYAQNPRLRPMGENRQLYGRHRNGSEIQVEIRLSALQTEEGLLVLSTIRDITSRGDLPLKTSLVVRGDQLNTEGQVQKDDLFEARERALGTLNSISDAVISTDLAGSVNYLNSTAEKMTGWSRADATGRTLQEVLTITEDNGRKSTLVPPGPATQTMDIGSAAASGVLTRRDGAQVAIEHSLGNHSANPV